MTTTAEAAWRRRTRTPVLLATAVAWSVLVATTTTHHLQGARMAGPMTERPSLMMAALMATPMAALMVGSMMTPLLIPAVRHALARSLPRRRKRAVTLLVSAHVVVWLVSAIVLQTAAPWLLSHLGPTVAPVTVLACALVWQMTPLAQRWANRHHALPPVAAFGARADFDMVSFGARHATACLGACWVLMLWPELAGSDQLPAMAIAAAWVWAQAIETPTRPQWRLWLPRRTGRLISGLWRSVARTAPG